MTYPRKYSKAELRKDIEAISAKLKLGFGVNQFSWVVCSKSEHEDNGFDFEVLENEHLTDEELMIHIFNKFAGKKDLNESKVLLYGLVIKAFTDKFTDYRDDSLAGKVRYYQDLLEKLKVHLDIYKIKIRKLNFVDRVFGFTYSGSVKIKLKNTEIGKLFWAMCKHDGYHPKDRDELKVFMNAYENLINNWKAIPYDDLKIYYPNNRTGYIDYFLINFLIAKVNRTNDKIISKASIDKYSTSCFNVLNLSKESQQESFNKLIDILPDHSVSSQYDFTTVFDDMLNEWPK